MKPGKVSGERDCRGVAGEENEEVGCYEKDFKGRGLPDNKV